LTDEELMEELKRGSEQSLQLLHQRYAPLVFATAARSLGPAAAEDVVQEVLLSVWRARETYRAERGLFRPWLLEIAHSKILNELRRRRRKPGEPLELEALTDGADGPPEAALWEEQRRQALDRALAELPPNESRALRLAFFGELSHSEVAAFVQEPLGTVKTRIRTGLGRMLRALNPVFGTTLLALIAALGGLWLTRAGARRGDRAVRMLSLSDSQTIRLAAAEGIAPETHGTFRWHPEVASAVVTLSHAPPLETHAHHVAWAEFDGHWVRLCELTPAGDERELCVTETTGVGKPPPALLITAELHLGPQPAGQPIVRWSGP
jgi:RNA polymerase sigma-70 factor (ECF subfamily)